MSDRLTVVLLVMLIAIVAVVAYLQVEANTRQEELLKDIHRELVQLRTPLPPQTVEADQTPPPPPPPPPSPPVDPPTNVSTTDTTAAAGQTAETTPPDLANATPPDQSPPPDNTTEPGNTPEPDNTSSGTASEQPINDSGQNLEPPKADDDKDWMAYRNAIAKVIDDLLAGREQAVYQQFNSNLASYLTLDQLRKVMQPIRAKHGQAMRISEHQRLRIGVQPEHHAYQVMVETERDRPLLFTITIDEQDKIAGLFVK